MRNRSVASAFNAFAKLFTAAQKADPTGMEDMLDNLDQWSDNGAGQRTPPSAASLRLGSDQSASGGGATTMADDFSNPTPQTGISDQYGQVARTMQRLTRAETREMLRADDTTYAGRAVGDLRKARAALMKAEFDGETEKETHLQTAAQLLDSARKLLCRAVDDEAADPASEEDGGAIARAAGLLKRLTATMKGLRAGGDSSVVARSDSAGMPTITAGQLMNTVAGRGLATPPDMMATHLAKAASAAESIAEKIEAMEDAGILNSEDVTMAMSLVQHLGLAKAGRIDMNIVTRELELAPERIRQVFDVGYRPAQLIVH